MTGDLIHELPEREVGLDRRRVAHHQVANPQTVERLPGCDVAGFSGCRLEEEPTDECEPGAAERALEDEQRDPAAISR